MAKKIVRGEWVLFDTTHPRFNVWIKRLNGVDLYRGCFYKGVNPNELKREE